jgi:hypothetical protein
MILPALLLAWKTKIYVIPTALGNERCLFSAGE